MTTDDAREQAIETLARIRSDQWAAEMRTTWRWDELHPNDQDSCRQHVAPYVDALLRTQAAPVDDEQADMEDYLARLAGGILARARRAEAERDQLRADFNLAVRNSAAEADRADKAEAERDQLRRQVEAVRRIRNQLAEVAEVCLADGGVDGEASSRAFQLSVRQLDAALDGAEGGADRG